MLMMSSFMLLALAVLLVIFAIAIYNGLVGARNAVRNGWNQIDVQLKRRYDLIPNLVETVKGYAKHEAGLFEAVTRARASAMSAGNRSEKIAAEGALTGALANVLAVAERYPELKANQNFLALQEELTSTENKIAFARQAYNDGVMSYNNKREMFPSSVFAGLFNFGEEPYWKITELQQREAPRVSF